MNEAIFFLHLLATIACIRIALFLGKEACITLICFLAFLANTFVLKQIQLFSLHVTASDVYAVGCLVLVSLTQRSFGGASVKIVPWLTALILGSGAVFSQLHLNYIPSEFDQSQAAFSTIFSPSFKIMTISILSFTLAQWLDIRLFQFLQKKLPTLSGGFLAPITSFFSTLFDTVFFTVIALHEFVGSMLTIILVSMGIKLISLLALNFGALSWRRT